MTTFGAWTADGQFIPTATIGGGDFGNVVTDVFEAAKGPFDRSNRRRAGERIANANDDIVPDKTKTVDLREFLKATGWPDKLVEEAAAILWCESTGQEKAVNEAPCTPDGQGHAVGFFQICQGGGLDRGGVEKLKIGEYNSKKAQEIYKERNGWGAWACTTANPAPAGAKITVTESKSLLGALGAAASGPLGALAGTTNPITAVAAAIKAIADLLSNLFKADTWLRILKTGLGGVLVVAGVGVLLVYGISKAANVTPVKAAGKSIGKGWKTMGGE